MMSIQQHPDYHQGFFDAADGEPLFENDCSPEYKAGWIAFHELRAIADRKWEDVPAELRGRFPAHYARGLH